LDKDFGLDYIYVGRTQFTGLNKSDELRLSENQEMEVEQIIAQNNN
jgi:hypothetical protein